MNYNINYWKYIWHGDIQSTGNEIVRWRENKRKSVAVINKNFIELNVVLIKINIRIQQYGNQLL